MKERWGKKGETTGSHIKRKEDEEGSFHLERRDDSDLMVILCQSDPVANNKNKTKQTKYKVNRNCSKNNVSDFQTESENKELILNSCVK